MADAFQSGAFQADAFQFGGTIGPVWPLPAQVLLGVIYGPNGNDYTGTLSPTGGGNKIIYLFDD